MKVGFIWTAIIKYILPIFLIIIWVMEIIDLFMKANQFEFIIYILLSILILVLSAVFYKKKSVKNT